MRLERDLLTEQTNAGLRNFGLELSAMTEAAVELAKARGELVPEAPVRDIAQQIAGIANTSGSFTMDTGSFEQLENFYLGFSRLITHAYGRKTEPTPVRRRSQLSRAG
jgi:hypothetical protein